MAKKRSSSAPVAYEPPRGPLAKQNCYGNPIWTPGEVPCRPFTGIINAKPERTPYGQGPLAVQTPENCGYAVPPGKRGY